jgi:AcrR family transcriptional regulator
VSCNVVDVTDRTGPGRPRSAEVRTTVLAAALGLVERDGYPAVTMKAIAEAAGVGRQTVYRWWPTKADVVLEALVDLAERRSRPARTGRAVADLCATLRATFAQVGARPAMTGLMAEATHDRGFAARLQAQLLAPRRAVVREILAAGQASGQLGAGVGLDLATDIVFGVMWYRVLSGHAPVDQGLADDLTATVTRLLG